MDKVYIKDGYGNNVLPVTHVDAVLDSSGNSVSSILGSFSDRLDLQDSEIGLLNGSDVEVVANHTGVVNPDPTKIYREPEIVTSPAVPTYYKDWMWDSTESEWKQIAQYNFPGIDTAPTSGSQNLVGSGGVFNSVIQSGIFDLSAQNSGASYANLSAALTALNSLSSDYKKGGMTIRYIESVSEVYVQYRYMSTSMASADITNTSNWQGVDDKPAASSKNLVESGGVFSTAIDSGITNVSEINKSDSTLATYDSLSAALAATPPAYKKGGMSLKFILRTNTGTEEDPVYSYKYVQYRLMATTWSNNISNWRGVDDNPVVSSNNLIISGGVYRNLGNPRYYADSGNRQDSYEAGILDLYIDKTLIDLQWLNARCYSISFYLLCKIVGSDDTVYLINGKSFNTIENYVALDITYNQQVIGYIVFKDKQKFLDYSSGSTNGNYLLLPYVTNPHMHPYANLIKGIVDTDNIKDGAVTSSKMANGVIPVVVDNLNTDDSAKALSATQGKVIADATMTLVEGENLLDPATIIIGKIARRTDGDIVSSSTAYGCTPLIPFDNDLICNSSLAGGGTILCGCVGYNSNGSFEGYVSAVDYGKPLAIIKESHPTWTHVIFNLYPNEGNQYAVYKGSTLPLEFIPYAPPYWRMKDATIPDGFIETRKLGDNAVTPEKASFFSLYPTSINILNPATIIIGYYARKDNGVLTTSTTVYGCTQPIQLTEDIICNSCMETYGSYIAGCVGYDADGTTRLGYISASARGGSLAIIKSSHPDWAYVRFNLAPNSDNQYAVYKGQTLPSEFIPYTPPVLKIGQAYIPPISDADVSKIIDALGEQGIYSSEVQISLPDKIYAVRGDVLQIFYQGIVVAPNIEVYDILITCPVGKGLYRYYQYDVPEDATLGSKDWTITVKDANGNVLASKTTPLIIIDKGHSPASNKNVLCVGDSLTAGGVWPSEMKRRLTGEIGTGSPAALGLTNVSFIGSMSKTVDGTQVNFEGRSGWSWTDYDDAGRGSTGYRFVLDGIYNVSQDDTYTNNDKTYTITEVNNETGVTILLADSTSGNTITGSTLTKASGSGDATLTFTSGVPEGANPFWNAALQKLDFVNYVENVCGLAVGTKIDYVYFCMTWNSMPMEYEDDKWITYLGCMKTIVDAIHSDYPDCKVKLMGVQFVYPPTFRSAKSWQDSMGYIRKVARMNKEYQNFANSDEESGISGDAYNTFVEFVNVSSQFDSKYNMTNSEKDANTRNSTYKERFTNNSIHPATSGYLQIGDVAYRNICNELQ